MNVKSVILKKHFDKQGFDDAFFESYETVTSDEMQHLDELCNALYNARCSNQKIIIYTDFDVDGIMSSVIAYAGLSELNFDVALFKPTPSDGYGFRPKDVDDILSEYPTAAIIFTGDVGIACNETIDYARSKGLRVFVTDHHIGTDICSADVAVNPNQFGETYSHNGICGAYVVYKVLERFSMRFCDSITQASIYRLQMFAGIATVSDMMPLLYENRSLVRVSVRLMQYLYEHEPCESENKIEILHSDTYKQAFVGMKKLLEYFASIKKIRKSSDIDEQFYGFYLVPFLNSCKRMNGDMRGIYDVFFNRYIYALSDFPNMACVENGIKYIEILSERRKELTLYYFDTLSKESKDCITEFSALMPFGIYITDAPTGLLGLLASKFMSYSGIPTLVLNMMEDGSYCGSGRNPSWFSFSDELSAYGLNITCRGHKEAFGVFIPDHDTLCRYIDFYSDIILPAVKNRISEGLECDTSISVSHELYENCDFVVDNTMIKDFIDEMALYHPYGQNFPLPVITYRTHYSAVKEHYFGDKMQHVKLIVGNVTLLLFDMALDFEKIKFDNKGNDFVFECTGIFKYDDFNESDTIVFIARQIDVLV